MSLLKRNSEIGLLGCNTCGLNPMWVKSAGEVDISGLAYILGSGGFFNKWLREFFQL